MSRDYAASHNRKSRPRNTRVKPSRKSLPGWLWLVAGILIGTLINAVTDFSGDGEPEPSPAETAEPESGETESGESRQKPRFDFYTLLKESEVIVPDDNGEKPAVETVVIPEADDEEIAEAAEPQQQEEARETPVADQEAPQKPDSPAASDREVFVLQAGSFKSAADADSVRASLLLLNMHASVEKVTIAPGETWHRVLVGPFTNKSTLSEAQSTLSRNGIDSIQLKRRM